MIHREAQPSSSPLVRLNAGRRGRFAPWIGLLLLVVMCWSGSAARAECGDYVSIGNPSSEAMAHYRHQSHAALPDSHSTPCDGPKCRGQSPLPAAPAPAPSAAGGGHDALAAVLSAELLDIAVSFAPLSADQLISEDHSPPLKRPPRFGFTFWC